MGLSRSKSINLAITIQWTGLLDSRKLPLEEKRTAMRRAKTSGHKTCSSVVVAHLNIALSSVPSHPAFMFMDGTWAWLHLDLRPCALRIECGECVCVCDAMSQSGWVFFTCPYCMLSSYFVMIVCRMWNPQLIANCIDRGFP